MNAEPTVTVTEATVNKSPFDLADMGRQYPAHFLWSLQERAFEGLRRYLLEKSTDPNAATLHEVIDALVVLSVSAEELHNTGTLQDPQADLLATCVPDLVGGLAALGYEW